jgi:peptidoglycan/xylan/chitin deacetylase (PgdA/CDA1 family)
MTNTVFEQLLLLLHREYRVVSLAELLCQPQDSQGRQHVALTFDDGWADSYEHVFPLLLHYETPATVFLCPGLMEQGHLLPEERFARIWQWCGVQHETSFLLRDLRKWGLNGNGHPSRKVWSGLLKRLPLDAKLLLLSHLETTYAVPPCEERHFLTWEEVRIMRRSGYISFGSHTMRHCTLGAEQSDCLHEELRNSRRAIELQLQEEVRILAYPNGSWNQRVTEAAKQAGYSHCFTTGHGTFRPATNPMAIPRINIADAALVDSMSSFHASRVRFHLQRFAYQHT